LARENKINLICSHNCSVSSVRDCIAELKKSNLESEYPCF
jgi:hypothetical protein